MPGMTLIKVRGKRKGPAAGQWHKDKQRPAPKLPSSPSSRASSVAPQSQDSSAAANSRKRKRRERELSRLEELPSEVLQSIFEYSHNLDLPSVSPILLAQLSSGHMFNRLTDAILGDLVSIDTPPHADLEAIARLFESRFMTWAFFVRWLDRVHKDDELSKFCYRPSFPDKQPSDVSDKIVLKHIATPKKLLFAPLSASVRKFLRLFVACGSMEHCRTELVQEAVQAAIGNANAPSLSTFLDMCPEVYFDTDMLRRAVIDCGCNTSVVHAMLSRRPRATLSRHLDPLDQDVWKWAELACDREDERGAWLKKRLMEYNRAVLPEQFDPSPLYSDHGGDGD